MSRSTNLAADRPRAAGVSVRPGGEIILLVDDDDSTRGVAASALRGRGYMVVEARDANEAIEWSSASAVRPQLLVTGVGLRGLGGPNLAARLLQQHPHLRLLYLSERAEDATGLDGTSWAIPTLPKPFTPDQLADYVRYALDAAAGHV